MKARVLRQNGLEDDSSIACMTIFLQEALLHTVSTQNSASLQKSINLENPRCKKKRPWQALFLLSYNPVEILQSMYGSYKLDDTKIWRGTSRNTVELVENITTRSN
jgi:hypothetical protein